MKTENRESPALAPTIDRGAVLARLELDVTRRLDGLLQGDFLGLMNGPGSEPAEARAYAPGDDARRIDWNLTARASALHVRQTEADRELETWLLADRSPSLDFGTAHVEKRDLVTAALAVFGLRTIRNGNRVGLVLAGGDRLHVVPAQATRVGVLAALATAHSAARATTTPAAGADLLAGLARVDTMARRRGRVVVVSDFLDTNAWPAVLSRLSARHEVIAVHVVDRRELELPAVGLLSVVDTETGRALHVQTNSVRLRNRYREAAQARHDAIALTLRAAGAIRLELSTDRDWVTDVARFLARRRQPVRGGALTGGARR
jgi:uncharacterized protein (DUF58 family)